MGALSAADMDRCGASLSVNTAADGNTLQSVESSLRPFMKLKETQCVTTARQRTLTKRRYWTIRE